MNNSITIVGHVGQAPHSVSFGDTGNKVVKPVKADSLVSMDRVRPVGSRADRTPRKRAGKARKKTRTRV